MDKPAHSASLDRQLLLGNEAIARGAFEAGVKVISSYPGTPSTEITITAAKYPRIYTEWATNEKVGLEVAYGASLGGGRAMSCMKHVGLNVAADPLFTASYTGVNGGLVIVVADDPGMHSSQNEQDSRHYARAAKLMMFEPADSQECLDLTRQAFALSEHYDMPVMLRLTTRISHSRTPVTSRKTTRANQTPLRQRRDEVRHDAGHGDQAPRRGREPPEPAAKGRRCRSGARLPSRLPENLTKLGILTSGMAYQYVREALPDASISSWAGLSTADHADSRVCSFC